MNQSIDWAFGLLWCAVSATAIFVGGFVAIYAGFFLGGLVGHAVQSTNEGIAGYVVFWTLVPLILSAAVGVAQGWLLKDRLPTAQWFGATLGGGVIAAAIIVGIGFNDASVGANAASLAVWLGTAFTQWWLLKSFSARAIVWLVVPILLMAGTVQIPIALGQPNSMISQPPIIILVYGIVTAILIVWILQTAQTRSME